MTLDYVNKNKQWTNKQRKFIKDNYLLMSNLQLGEKLGRTEDSVRKEFKKLGLTRPKKSDFPKVSKKRGRKRKILSLSEAIKAGIEKKRKLDKAKDRVERKRIEEQRRIANEVLWANGFVDNNCPVPACIELNNPIIVSVPEYRANFQINRSLPEKKIQSRIAAINKKYGSEIVIVKNR